MRGAPWVQVTPSEAAAHPKGRPGLVLWLVAGWFAATGAFEVVLAIWAGASIWWAFFGGLALVAALGLAIGAPWSLVLAVLLAARQVIGLARDVKLVGSIAVTDQLLPLLVLGQAVVAAGVVFYLLEGDRPNLIFRHRYRAYSEADHDA
ncbi:hypothetical protein AAD018_013230 [Aestuariibius insulae]|uniref:hypothetical protein n=1 Tax=Aestuariibius insulae TaxID=2058287 RepID=UPI00345F0C4D